jgi:hypothetical protein
MKKIEYVDPKYEPYIERVNILVLIHQFLKLHPEFQDRVSFLFTWYSSYAVRGTKQVENAVVLRPWFHCFSDEVPAVKFQELILETGFRLLLF